MQDNLHNNKEFEDRSWEQMRKMLDKDKPVAPVVLPQQGNRRLWLLLLLAFVLFFATLAGGMFMKNDFFTKKSTKKKTTIASSSENTNSNMERTIESVLKNEEEPDENLIKEKAENISNSATQKNIQKTKKSSTFVNQYLKKIEQNRDVENKLINLPMIFEEDKIREEKEEPIALIEEEKEQIFIKNEKAISSISILTPKEIKILEEELSIVTKISTNKLIKPQVFLGAGLRSYDFEIPNSISLGLGLSFAKEGNKIGIKTGLNYSYRNSIYLVSERSIYEGFVDFNATDEMIGQGAEVSSLDDLYIERATIRNSEVRYHNLEIPLAVNYKFSKRWSAYAGINSRVILYSPNYTHFGLINISRNADATALSGNGAYDPAQSGNFFKPEKLDFEGLLGLSLNMTNRLYLNFQFQQGLKDVYPNLEGKQTTNSLQLGIGYRLK